MVKAKSKTRQSMMSCVLLGAGGHGRVVLEALQLEGAYAVQAILDPNSKIHGYRLSGVAVIGDDHQLQKLKAKGVRYFAMGLGGTSDNQPRERLFKRALQHGLSPATVRHPSAWISPSARVGIGCVILPMAVVHTEAVLGMNVIVNTGAIVEHECKVGNHVHVATRASLASNVIVKDGAHIGAGAVVRQCITIGEGAVIGAGAVVTKDVPSWTVVMGVPARLHREVRV